MLRMIIADDEFYIREGIKKIIDWSKLGIEIIGTCSNGIETYNMILDDYPDIVLTDIKMPGITGLELIQQVSQSKAGIQYVILSGYGEFELAQKAMAYGVRHYLLKPCNVAELTRVMQSVVQESIRAKKLLQYEEQLLDTVEPDEGEDKVQTGNNCIDFMISYVNAHLDDPSLTLKNITENILYMNVDYVSKLFSKKTGTKFSAYVTEKRIEKAKELLQSSSVRVSNVAKAVGFGNNPQYFYQIFKKCTGYTPGAYAKKMQKQMESPDGDKEKQEQE